VLAHTVAVALVWLAGARPVSAQFTIEELEIHITGGERQAVTRLIPVKSESDSVQQVRLWMSDWTRDSLGNNIMVDFGTGADSCGERLSVFPLTLQLTPRATEYVRVTYDPRDANDPGCWGIVLSENVRPPRPDPAGTSASVTITTIVGVKVYVHAANARAAGTIVGADVEEYWDVQTRQGRKDSTFVRDVAVRFENTGTAHLRVKSSVEIRDETTRVVQRIEGPEAYITPRAFRDIIVRVPALPKGRYVAVVLLDHGADEITATQLELEVP
jgi:hypothetical protein